MASPPELPRSTVRPEIQALRAVAVCAVVLHHGWPAVAPAGYMGVDVFFVVSGFLITGLLLRDAGSARRISLKRFYERRARRILPAAVATLLAVSVLTLLFVPQREWSGFFREIVTSTLYVENWQLAADSQNPARDDLRSTPVQHFWSLSVEEQFYLVWPFLVVGSLWFARVRGASVRTVAAVALVVVTIASFAYGVALTAADHNLAYFSTIARGWEFGIGGLLALAAAPVGRERLRTVISWLGIALIVVPIVTFTGVTVFPGWVAVIPVAGTLAVIWAGMPLTSWSTARLTGLAPVQWVGDVSYSLYLWHWPVFMFVPYVTGVPSPPWLMVLLVGLSLAIAGLSKRWIEDPFRIGTTDAPLRRPAVILSGLGVAAALLLVTGFAAPQVAASSVTTHHGSR
ncbi:acyltransferase family protein [Agromyces albus]|uniref:acyltransferase family protein n=1 Tax=Agromyces albus TaxID=205332 RepID=UPI0027D82CFD|nr:acyltransferase [Agromyces albus]